MKANIIRILTVSVVLTLILVLQASSGWSSDDSTSYQMVPNIGTYDKGAIIKINLDDSSFTILYSFAGGTSDGANPSYQSNLTLSDSILYGMTQNGGSNDKGVIFKISMDGSGFTILHSFAGGSSDGANPSYGSLTLSGSTLYGMTQNGGSDDKGVIFKINTNGSDFSILRSFAGGTSDGANPNGSLALSDSTLYGMTQNGGPDDKGVIFKINTDSSDFSILRSFAGGTSDGANPYGELTLLSNPTVSSGSTLCGRTNSGGTYGYGGGFSIKTDGTYYSGEFLDIYWEEFKEYHKSWVVPPCKWFWDHTTIKLKYSITYDEKGPHSSVSLEGETVIKETNSCTLVSLNLFTTQIQDSNIFLEWETASELDNAGFNLWRSESEDGEYFKINPAIIEANGGTVSREYFYIDYMVIPGVTYYYELEDIDTSGVSTVHGPISTVIPAPQSIYLLNWYQMHSTVPAWWWMYMLYY